MNIILVFILKLIAVILFISLYVILPNTAENQVLLQVIKGINSFLIPSVLLSIIRFVVISLYNARHANKSVRGNFVLGVNRVTSMFNAMFLVIAIMVGLGINPIEFVTSLTIVAMAIAVIFRDYITNLISGLFIMFSDQLSVGDRIKVGEHRGRIVDITFANLELQNEEDDIVMVPNNLVFSQPIVNLSAHRSHLFTVKFELPLHLATDINALEEEIISMLSNHPNIDSNNPPLLKVEEIGKDYVRYKFELYAISSSNNMHREIQNEVLREILLYEHHRTKSS